MGQTGRGRAMARRAQRKAPEGYVNWHAYWYERIKEGTPIADLVSSPYGVSDIRGFARQYALKHGLPLPKVLEYVRPPRAGRVA